MTNDFWENLRGKSAFFVGIKGTGMSALAEIFRNAGVLVSGSDAGETFYTDAVLKSLDIPYFETFDAAHIRKNIDLIVHSAAYSLETHPELREAARMGVPILKYTDALGAYSALFDSSGIAGVHGKTTTTALTGSLLQGAGVPAQILAGSAVASFNGHSTLSLGNKYFIAETCEYRRHFLSFHPKRIVLTGVESDHQDYYPTYESIRDAFIEYAEKLPAGGACIFCADDAGACEVAEILKKKKKEIQWTPYGFTADGAFQITDCSVKDEKLFFALAGFGGQFTLRVPGRHNALNAAAAFALVSSLVKAEFGGWDAERLSGAKRALENFRGSKRRSEIIGEAGGVLFMDDYAHHPTAIKTTIQGIKAFYPQRRLIVSFMSHTYTRTAALLDDFAHSLSGADILILHKIYASAREKNEGGVTGKTLFNRAKECNKNIFYEEEPIKAAELVESFLKSGDLFLTMGAGDNWKLGEILFKNKKIKK
jgi:UDP-N-acetylmuramate--alanine ligase